MIVEPYKRTPVPPTVSYLTSDGLIVSEHEGAWVVAALRRLADEAA